MKRFKSIIILAGFACTITMFWLAPGINKADTGYVRIYEDTYSKPIAVKALRDGVNQQNPTPVERKGTKKYLKEKIKADAELEDIKLEMFSRAIHFHEDKIVSEAVEVEMDSAFDVALDSVEFAMVDSVRAMY
jgi:hypothetical protein